MATTVQRRAEQVALLRLNLAEQYANHVYALGCDDDEWREICADVSRAYREWRDVVEYGIAKARGGQ